MIDFDVVVIQFVKGNGIIWSDIANRAISLNGIYVGIRVDGIVFCNVHSYGLPQKEWEEDFHGTGIKNNYVLWFEI